MLSIPSGFGEVMEIFILMMFTVKHTHQLGALKPGPSIFFFCWGATIQGLITRSLVAVAKTNNSSYIFSCVKCLSEETKKTKKN